MRNLRILFLLLLITGASCKTLMTYTNVLNCDFRMETLTNTKLAGISIQKLNSFSDLNFLNAGSLTKAYLSGNIPLSFQLNIEGKNPNTTAARIAKFDWILLIDDVQMVSGTNEREYQIAANGGTQLIPLNISVNLLEVINNETKSSLLNFAFNLADAGNKPTRVAIKIKPTIYVGSIPIAYPGYIDLGTEFGG